MRLRDLTLRLRALIAPRQVERELDEELAFHLEREIRKQLAEGLSPADARARALARFGSVPLAADRCRDARGTAFVDGCIRDILYALRTFRRAPVAACTIVATVALGLGLVAVVFTLFNVFVFRVDAVRNPGELFAVIRPAPPGGDGQGFTRPQYESLRRETDVFVDVFAMLGDLDSRIDGRMMAGTLVTGNFFQVLGVEAALGRTLMPADDQPASPRPVMVLSHRGWARHFSKDPAAVGRSLMVNGQPYLIVGVMPDGFRGLSVGAPDYWAPLSLLAQFRPIHAGREDAVAIGVIGRLKPGLPRRTALAGLMVWEARRASGGAADRRPPALALEPRQGTVPHPGEALLLFTPLFFAFGLILLIGCANVANLLLARAVARQREIGVRLSLGGSRRRIIRQLLTESLLLALAAAALGFVVSRVALEATVYAVSSTLAPEFADYVRFAVPAADWRVGVFLVAGAIGATVFFALAPAVQATRLELVRTIRGEVTRDARPGRARSILIGVQVTASALLLICSAVFLRSTVAAAGADPGMRIADTVIIDIVNEPFRRAMVQAVLDEPLVTAVAASAPGTLSRPRIAFAEAPGVVAARPDGRPAAGAAPAARSAVAYTFVSPEYFAVLDVDLLRGRGFTREEAVANAPLAILSESVARQLWPDADPLGQILRLDPELNPSTRREDEPMLPGRAFTVVGIARDVPGFRFADHKPANVYVPTSPAVAETELTVRVKGDPEQARVALIKRLTAIDPNMGEIMTMRTLARMERYLLQIAFWLTFVLGVLALALTLSGLFSVLSYLVEQRAKEIGVRMALGATTRDVAWLVLSQSAGPVGFGLVAGSGLALALAIGLISIPAASQVAHAVHVLDPVAYLSSFGFIVLACVLASMIPTLRAARIDPMITLRQD